MNLNIYAVCLTLTLSLHAERPLFTFGVISDVQYADHDTAGARAYRDSAAKLEQCAAALKKENTEFVAHTGDLVDRDEASLDRILPIWNTIPGPRYLALGNHDFVTARDALIKRLGMPGAWYDFTRRSRGAFCCWTE